MGLSKVNVEARSYGEESSAEERRILRERVYLLTQERSGAGAACLPAVAVWREVPVLSLFQTALFGQKLLEITAGLDRFSVLVDLTEAQLPNAAVRQCLRQFFGSLAKLDYVAVFTGNNLVIDCAARFVLGGSLDQTRYSVHKTQGRALEAIRDPGLREGKRADGHILRHISEITSGHCTITDQTIAQETDRETKKILTGLRFLFDDLVYRERQWRQVVDENLDLNKDLEEKVQFRTLQLEMDAVRRKQSQSELAASRQLLRAIIDAAPVRIFWKDRDSRFLGCNPVFARDAGTDSPDQVIGHTDYEMSWADQAEHYRADDREVMATGRPKLFYEEPQTTPDGRVIWLRTAKVPMRNDNHEIIGVLGIYDDITQFKQAEQAVLRSEANLRSMMDNSPYLTWMKDTDGRYLSINGVFAKYLGLENPEQAVGKTDLDLNPRDLAEKYRADDAEVMAGRRQKHVEEPAFDGVNLHWVETYKTPIIDAEGNVLGTVGFAKDITERKRIEAELSIAATAFEASQDGITITDAKGVILRVNQAFCRITGYSPEEVIGQTPRLLKSGRHDQTFYREMWGKLLNTGSWDGEIWDRRKNGEVFPKWLRISAVRAQDGTISNYVAAHSDISEKKAADESIKTLAFYDPLTHLPNRRLLIDRLHQSLVASTRSGQEGALIFIDMDHFKMVNDTLGHNVGDNLLQEVAQRLTDCLREIDTAARSGGDEFMVMLENLSSNSEEAASQAISVGEKIIAAFSAPFLIQGHTLSSTPSIGITLYGEQRDNMDELFKQADIAMYQAKAAGRNTIRFFDPDLQALALSRVAQEADMRRGIVDGDFRLHYQPQIEYGRVVGAEALVRWHHPQHGLVPPADFIPLAEETGIILPLGRWILETACAQIARWSHSPEMSHLTLAVNISAKQFHEIDFVDQLVGILARTGARPANLKLELTESLLLGNTGEIIARIKQLENLGLSLSLDDFGTGFSSLGYLKLLPISQLKIDQSFIRDILTDTNDAVITRTIISLCQNMRLGVIAEGVETREQLEFLRLHGCHAFQGYLFSKPVPLEEFERYVEQARLALVTDQL